MKKKLVLAGLCVAVLFYMAHGSFAAGITWEDLWLKIV